MNLESVKKLPPLSRFLYFIREREAVRIKKTMGSKPPYTTDPILQQYRFCNVRRMDDRVSDWLLRMWYRPNQLHENLIIGAAYARFFNWPPTLEAIGEHIWCGYRPEKIKEVLKARRKEGLQIFNGAYLISPGKSSDKIDHIVDLIVEPLYGRQDLIDLSSIQNTCLLLGGEFGIGSFMAGQIAADLRWAMSSGAWHDKDTWAAIGPGSRRGMNRLHEREPTAALSQEKFEAELTDLMKVCRKKLSIDISDRLEAIDYQNCCCEYQKYERTLWGQGRPKSHYKPFEGY